MTDEPENKKLKKEAPGLARNKDKPMIVQINLRMMVVAQYNIQTLQKKRK